MLHVLAIRLKIGGYLFVIYNKYTVECKQTFILLRTIGCVVLCICIMIKLTQSRITYEGLIYMITALKKKG